jgi:hypothetical protein
MVAGTGSGFVAVVVLQEAAEPLAASHITAGEGQHAMFDEEVVKADSLVC